MDILDESFESSASFEPVNRMNLGSFHPFENGVNVEVLFPSFIKKKKKKKKEKDKTEYKNN